MAEASVRPYPLGQGLDRDKFSYNHFRFRRDYPSPEKIRLAAAQLIVGKLDGERLSRDYLVHFSLWGDDTDERKAALNKVYDLSAVTASHVGQTIMVVEAGGFAELNAARADFARGNWRRLPSETVINIGRVAQGPSVSGQTRSNLEFRTRYRKHEPHPRLPIPSPSLSFEIGLKVTHAQQIIVDEFGRSTVTTGEPTGKTSQILMIEGGAPINRDADYGAGRQFVDHEFVIGTKEAYGLVQLLYGLDRRGDMQGFDESDMRRHLPVPDLNTVFA